MFGGDALAYWLTLWLSLQLSLDDLHPSGAQRVHYDPVPNKDVQYWTRHMAEIMLQFRDEEVEFYLPQLVAVLARRDSPSRNPDVTTKVAANLAAFMQARCRANHHIGMRLLWQLRAAARDAIAPVEAAAAAAASGPGSGAAGYGDAGGVLGLEGAARGVGQLLKRRLEYGNLVRDYELATMLGDNLPTLLRHRRIRYHSDCMRFVERLVWVSHMLRMLPHKYRLSELQMQLGDLNKCLLRRMHTRGRAFEAGTPRGDRSGPGPGDGWHDGNVDRGGSGGGGGIDGGVGSIDGGMDGGGRGGGGGGGGGEWLDEGHVASECPEAAHFALHLPLRVMEPGDGGGRRVMRVLRIAKELCCVLPSRERAPFLVVAEVLQTTLRHGSDRIYTEGGQIGLLALDVVEQRSIPPDLLKELQVAHGATEWADVAGSENGDSEAEQYAEQPVEEADDHDRGGRGGRNGGDDGDGHGDDSGVNAGVGGGGMDDEGSSEEEGDEEREDRAFFQRAFHQYLHTGSIANPYIQRMRLIMTQVFENMSGLRERVFRASSPFGRLKGWRLATFIVKAGDDVRQEALAMQVITLCHHIFQREGLSLWLRPYSILCVGNQAGLVECITDAKSIDHIKKKTPNYVSMRDFFDRLYMGRAAGLYGRAQDNFVRSLAGYSIITYILQVKDRHNANIMLDNRGHIIHIDFGFILGASPGMWKHEMAPFKLTQDYLDIMGGMGSVNWHKFRHLFLEGFKAVRKHADELVSLVTAMAPPNDRRALVQVELLRKRLEDVRTDDDIHALIDRSANSWTTQQYDLFQYVQNGIST